MEGVRYVTDENNKKIAIQISFERYGDIIEDLLDSLLIEDRKKEVSVPLNEVISELKNKGNLDKYVQG